MDGAQLRAAALDAWGPHADARAEEMLRGAEVVLDEAVRTWTASVGTVRGHRVRLRVDARSLGVARAVPGVLDALHAAFTRAVGVDARACLVELTLEWNGSVSAEAEGYRGAAPREASLVEAVAAFLEGAGEPEAAAHSRTQRITSPSTGRVAVRGTRASDALEALTREALRSLFGARVAIDWQSDG